jgi:hypothetical protein
MKTNHTKKIGLTMAMTTSLAALSVLASPPIVTIQVPAPPVVIAPAPVVVVPAPGVTVEAAVPDTYVWDGTEYVGMIGTQYYYLGSDKSWLPFDADHETRFHDWEKGHADWHTRAVRNDLYRRDARGHEYPREDKGHDHDHDHDNHN